jgi:hypothetical protein
MGESYEKTIQGRRWLLDAQFGLTSQTKFLMENKNWTHVYSKELSYISPISYP